MNKEYRNLATAMEIFNEEYDLSIDQCLGVLRRAIINKYIDEAKLKEELTSALSDVHFDWVTFGIEHKFVLYAKENQTNEGVKTRLKSYLSKVL